MIRSIEISRDGCGASEILDEAAGRASMMAARRRRARCRACPIGLGAMTVTPSILLTRMGSGTAR
jgi:hypothetical protein